MTSEEVKPYVGTRVRVILDDRRVIAGRLQADGENHYSIVSPPVREGDDPVSEVSAERIVSIEDASGDPAT